MAKDLNELSELIKLLIRQRDERFAFEGPLRLFQFKGWLLDDRDLDLSFKRLGLLFVALALRRAEQRAAKQSLESGTVLTASKRITSFYKNKKWRDLVDGACGNNGILNIATVDWHPYYDESIEDDLKEIEVLNRLTELRMRIHATSLPAASKRMEASVTKGLLLLALDRKQKKSAKIIDDDAENHGDAKRIRTERRLRESFLFAAAHGHDWIIKIESKRTLIFGQMGHEWREVDRLKAFFAAAKAYLDILDKETAKGLSKSWSSLPAISLPTFDPLQAETFADAGIETIANPRRAATTTKRAMRQRSRG